MIVQIYEIGNPNEAREVALAGVDHIGVLVGNGEFLREIKIREAREALNTIPGSSKKVVLTLSRNLTAIMNIAEQLTPDILHLGTVPEGISPRQVEKIRREFPYVKIMRSIPIIGEMSIGMAKQYEDIVDFLLLDSYKKEDGQVGATGTIHDWSFSRRIVDSVNVPVILAGGLGPQNVAEAIRQVHPAGVDSKTMTDKKNSHEKDLEKVKAFVAAAKNVFA